MIRKLPRAILGESGRERRRDKTSKGGGKVEKGIAKRGERTVGNPFCDGRGEGRTNKLHFPVSLKQCRREEERRGRRLWR